MLLIDKKCPALVWRQWFRELAGKVGNQVLPLLKDGMHKNAPAFVDGCKPFSIVETAQPWRSLTSQGKTNEALPSSGTS